MSGEIAERQTNLMHERVDFVVPQAGIDMYDAKQRAKNEDGDDPDGVDGHERRAPA